MDVETVEAMQHIADASARERLRDDAATFNQRFGWASAEEFASMFPLPEDQREIDTLTAHVWGNDRIEHGSIGVHGDPESLGANDQ